MWKNQGRIERSAWVLSHCSYSSPTTSYNSLTTTSYNSPSSGSLPSTCCGRFTEPSTLFTTTCNLCVSPEPSAPPSALPQALLLVQLVKEEEMNSHLLWTHNGGCCIPCVIFVGFLKNMIAYRILEEMVMLCLEHQKALGQPYMSHYTK